MSCLDQAANIYFFFKKKSVFIFILDFPLFEIGWSLNGFSKIGLRLWVKDFFGWNCNHFLYKDSFWLDFPVFKIGLFQNGIAPKKFPGGREAVARTTTATTTAATATTATTATDDGRRWRRGLRTRDDNWRRLTTRDDNWRRRTTMTDEGRQQWQWQERWITMDTDGYPWIAIDNDG